MLPRTFWWTLYALTLLDFVLNVVFHSRKDAVLINVVCLALTSHRLAYPPGDA